MPLFWHSLILFMPLTLSAEPRAATGKHVGRLRAEGKIPAVLYGRGIANADIAVDARAFDTLYREAGESTLVDLAIGGGAPVTVLIQDIAHDPLKGQVIHIDFHQVRMDEKLTAEVGLEFMGESKAVKELGAVLVKNLNTIRVKCLPKDLVHAIRVDISVLANVHDVIRVKDVAPPAGLELLAHADDVVATVLPAKTEEELKKELEAPTTADVTQVEVVKKEKKEEEGEAAEGAEAPKGEKAEGKKEEKKSK